MSPATNAVNRFAIEFCIEADIATLRSGLRHLDIKGAPGC